MHSETKFTPSDSRYHSPQDRPSSPIENAYAYDTQEDEFIHSRKPTHANHDNNNDSSTFATLTAVPLFAVLFFSTLTALVSITSVSYLLTLSDKSQNLIPAMTAFIKKWVLGVFGLIVSLIEGVSGKIFVQGIVSNAQDKDDDKDNDNTNNEVILNDNKEERLDLASAAGNGSNWTAGDGWLVRAVIDLVDGIEKEWRATVESIEEKKRRKWYED